MPQIWTIGGGKGGTGKSFFTGSLGFLLAGQGRRTLLVDLDLGAANLHTIVGLSHPERSVADFIHKRVPGLEETVVATVVFPEGTTGILPWVVSIPHEDLVAI